MFTLNRSINMKLKFLVFAFTLIAFSINLYADEYKFDYAVIDNEKVTTVSASNITAHITITILRVS